MKIALVSTLYAPYQYGGAERSTQLLAEGLAQRGHDVCVITLGEKSVQPRGVVNGVRVERVPLENWYWPYSGYYTNKLARAAWYLRDFRNAAMSARVAAILDREHPQLVNTHSLYGFSVDVWREARSRGIPLVHTLRDYYLICAPGTMYRHPENCERVCARCLPFAAYRRRESLAVNAVVGISRFILERHVQKGFFARSHTQRVIHNALPALPRRAPKVPNGPLVYGYIGRIDAEKGIDWLLESFRQRARAGEKLVVAGTGEPGLVASLKARYASSAVSFIGHVDPAVLFEQVDVVVVPSLSHEPFGRAAIEPLSYGIPVIASNRGGLPEVVADGKTGILVDPDEPETLARAMERLSTEPQLVAQMSGRCSARLPQFSQEAIAGAYEDLFAEVLSPAPLQAAPIGARNTAA